MKESIRDARVMVLGEATHGHGATFRAKARIVRFLHQEMGFDVLAWGAGLLDAEGLNRTLSRNQPLDVATRQIMSGDGRTTLWCARYSSTPGGAGRPDGPSS